MRIETTINSGMPVIAEGEVVVDRDDIRVEHLRLYFRNGSLYTTRMDQPDEDRIINALIEAQEEEWAREGRQQ